MIEASLFERVQEKLGTISTNWQNTYAHRSEYLLSRLVVCDACEHHYVGTAAKSSRFHYYSCQTSLKRGKAACNASLLNRDKLEKAVMEQVQEQILSPENVRRYIEMALGRAKSDQEPSLAEKAVSKNHRRYRYQVAPMGRRPGAWPLIAGGRRRSNQVAAAGADGAAEDKSHSGKISLTRQDPANSYPVDGSLCKADASTAER